MRPVILAVAACFLPVLVGCASTGNGEGSDFEAGDDVRIAIVMEQPLDDGGYNSGWKRAGDKLLEEIPGTEITYVPNTEPGADSQRAFRALATQGQDLIVGISGNSYNDLLKVVDDFPDTRFVGLLGQGLKPNLGTVDFALEQGRYLDGIVAGSLTRSDEIGSVMGFPYPILQRSLNGFTLGARSVNPDVNVTALTVNSWYDPGKERQAAEALVGGGVDILVTNMNSPAVAAVAKAKDAGLIGNAVSQERNAPEQWLGSFSEDFSFYLVDAVSKIQAGTWEPEAYYGTVANGTIGMMPFPGGIPADVVTKVEDAIAKMRSGDLVVFNGPVVSNKGDVVVAEGDSLTSTDELVACCTWIADGATVD